MTDETLQNVVHITTLASIGGFILTLSTILGPTMGALTTIGVPIAIIAIPIAIGSTIAQELRR